MAKDSKKNQNEEVKKNGPEATGPGEVVIDEGAEATTTENNPQTHEEMLAQAWDDAQENHRLNEEAQPTDEADKTEK